MTIFVMKWFPNKFGDAIEWLEHNAEGKYLFLERDIKLVYDVPQVRKAPAIQFTDKKAATLFKLFWEDIIDYDVEIVE
jgi:hypothetical protein